MSCKLEEAIKDIEALASKPGAARIAKELMAIVEEAKTSMLSIATGVSNPTLGDAFKTMVNDKGIELGYKDLGTMSEDYGYTENNTDDLAAALNKAMGKNVTHQKDSSTIMLQSAATNRFKAGDTIKLFSQIAVGDKHITLNFNPEGQNSTGPVMPGSIADGDKVKVVTYGTHKDADMEYDVVYIEHKGNKYYTQADGRPYHITKWINKDNGIKPFMTGVDAQKRTWDKTNVIGRTVGVAGYVTGTYNEKFDNSIPKQQNNTREYDSEVADKLADKLQKLYSNIEVMYLNGQAEMRSMLNELSGGLAMFQLSNKRKQEFEAKLRKARPELDGTEIDAVLKSIEEFSEKEGGKDDKLVKKLELLALHWTLKANLILPEDGYKVIDALKSAEKNKVDPFAYSNPEEIIKEFGRVANKIEKMIDPDKYIDKGLSGKKVIKADTGAVITVYEVDNSDLGRKVSRELIDSHYGEDRNPWCLLARTEGKNTAGKSIDNTKVYWYVNYPGKKRIAFSDGVLSAFYGGDNWWSEFDKPNKDIPSSVSGKFIPDEPKSVKKLIAINESTGTSKTLGYEFGVDTKNNNYKKWDADFNLLEVKLVDGTEVRRTSKGRITREYLPDGTKRDWDGLTGKLIYEKTGPMEYKMWAPNGRLESESFANGVYKAYYENGNTMQEYTTDGDRTDYYMSGGKKSFRRNRFGVKEKKEWYENGTLKFTEDADGNKRYWNELGMETLSSMLDRFKRSAKGMFFQSTDEVIKGAAVLDKNKILIDVTNRSTDTLSHEYAHFYIAAFRDTPIVQEAIKKWGGEEQLVQAIGEQTVKQKGEVYGWWKKFSSWIRDLLRNLDKADKEDLVDVLTDAFLTNYNLNNTDAMFGKRSKSAYTLSALYNKSIKYVIDKIPAITEIGSEQEYTEYISTVFPNSKVQDLVNHTTTTSDLSKKVIMAFTLLERAGVDILNDVDTPTRVVPFTSDNVVYEDDGMEHINSNPRYIALQQKRKDIYAMYRKNSDKYGPVLDSIDSDTDRLLEKLDSNNLAKNVHYYTVKYKDKNGEHKSVKVLNSKDIDFTKQSPSVKKVQQKAIDSNWFYKESFNRDYLGTGDGRAVNGQGFYFAADNDTIGYSGLGTDGTIAIAKLNITKPLIRGSKEAEELGIGSSIQDAHGIIDYENRVAYGKAYSMDTGSASFDVVRSLKKQHGYDGIIAAYDEENNMAKEFVVPEPEQIHILGSNKDLKMFKEWKEQQKQEVTTQGKNKQENSIMTTNNIIAEAMKCME